MPDLHELLDDEARRQSEIVQPDMSALVTRYRRRRFRRGAAGAAALMAAVGLAAAMIVGLGIGESDPPASPGHPAVIVTVTGELIEVGGPAVGPYPVAGEVSFTGPRGKKWVTHAGSDGRFTIKVPLGTYQVIGTSPSYEDSQGICRSEAPVQVLTSGTPIVQVVCSIR